MVKKKTLKRMTVREIRNSFGRFFAIFAIIALGVGFFSGIRITTPAMVHTFDAFYKECHFYDYRALSTLGFEEEDIGRLREEEDAAAAEGGWQYDAIIENEAADSAVYKIYSIPDEVNQLKIVEGRLPENDTECVMDADNRMSLRLGDSIFLSDANEEDTLDALAGRRFTVTGFANSSLYINFERGTTSIGNGLVTGFLYLPKEAFVNEYYTEAYVVLRDGEDLFSDAYEERLEENRDRWEDTVQKAADGRYDRLRLDAENELADAKQEFEEKKADGEKELADAEKELEDGKKELDDAAAELEDGRKELDDAKKELADGKKELDDAASELSDARRQLKNAKAELDSGKKTLDASGKELADGKKKLDASEKELKEAKDELDASEKQLSEGKKQLDGTKKELDAAKEQLDATGKELASAEKELKENREKLSSAEAELKASEAELAAGKAELDKNEQELAAAQEQLAEAKRQIEMMEAQLEHPEALTPEEIAYLKAAYEKAQAAYAAGQAQYEAGMAAFKAGKEKYEAGKKQYEAGLAEYNAGLAALEAGEAQYKAGKEQYDAGLAQYNAGLAQYEQGAAKYEQGKAKYDAGLAAYEEGKKQFDKASAQYQSGKKQYDKGAADYRKGLAQYENGKAEYEQGLAEYESGRKKYEDGLAEYESAKAEYDEGVLEYEDGLKDYEEGLKEYRDGKETFDKEIADAEAEIADAEKELEDFEKPDTYLLERNTNIGYSCFESDSTIVEQIAKVFPVFFILVAVLVCMTTMTRMVEEQRGQIGILKGLGYSESDIFRTFAVYSGSAAALGCIFGYAVGIILFPSVIWTAYNIMYMKLPLLWIVDWKLALVLFAVSLICSVGTTYMSVRHELRESAASLLRPRAPKAGKRVFLEYIPALWSRMKFMHKISARNIFRYKKRFFMMVIGISGCMALLLTGFGIKDSIASFAQTQYGEIQVADADLVFHNGEGERMPRELQEEADKMGADVMLYEGSSWDLLAGGKVKSVNILSPAETGDIDSFFRLRDREGGVLSLPAEGEALISVSIAERYRLGEGDTLHLRNEDMQTITARIAGVFDNHVYNYVILAPGTIAAATGEYNVNGAFINFPEDADIYEAQARLASCEDAARITVFKDFMERLTRMMDSLNYIVILVILSAAGLALIVLYNLTNINILERIREIATIKVLGFYRKETADYVFRENIVLTCFGAAVGLFLGVALHRFVMKQIVIDLVYFNVSIRPVSFLWSVLLTFAFTFLVNQIMSLRIEKINMAESLKSVE